MKSLLRLGCALLCLAIWVAHARAQERLICCGGAEVFVISSAQERSVEADRLWRWQATASPEIPAAMHGQFRTTDDCKPYPDKLLITSSSGGVALVDRESKKCLFFTSVKNAHSACLLPKERIAVASSSGGDELLLFSLKTSGEKLAPDAKLKLTGAHGAHWDKQRERLWALGSDELLLVAIQEANDKIELAVKDRWKLPTAGGHDLSPARDERYLSITTNSAVYRFDTKEQKFSPFEPLADAVAIKSIDEHPTTGQIVYHQANHAEKVWWSDTIRLLSPAKTIQLPDERLYKIRWDVVRD